MLLPIYCPCGCNGSGQEGVAEREAACKEKGQRKAEAWGRLG